MLVLWPSEMAMLPAATPWPPLRSASGVSARKRRRQRRSLDRLGDRSKGLVAGDAGGEELVHVDIGFGRIVLPE